jgi:hypothetical protein
MSQAKVQIDYKAINKRLADELDDLRDERDEKEVKIQCLEREVEKLTYELKRLRINGCQPRGEE